MRKSPEQEKKGEDDVKEEVLCDKKSNMFFIITEIFLVFGAIFTTYASILNKTKKITPPAPFFWPGCLVEDFYGGDLHSLMNNIAQSSVSIVMYYAPWDADCQDSREVFEEAAQFFGGEVYFASVNCWQPGSECRDTFKNIPRYPQIAAYKGPLNAVDYLGPLTADDIIKFIDSVMNPMIRVNTVSEIWQLRFRHDALLVGCLKMDGLRSARGYNLFYKLAWKMAGWDHTRRLAFAILTHDKINRALSVARTPSFILYLWNKRIEYKGELQFEEIRKWLKSELRKNELIKTYIQLDGVTRPVVITLFSSHNPLLSYSPLYHMLKQIAMKFNECIKNDNLTDDFSFYNHLLSGQNYYSLYEKDIVLNLRKEREICSRTNHVYNIKTCSALSTTWTNYSCHQQTCSVNNFKSFRDTGMEANETFEEMYWRRKCHLVRRAQESKDQVVSRVSDELINIDKYSDVVNVPQITACDINKTVVFTFIDPERHPQLASALGHTNLPSLFIYNDDEVVKFDKGMSEKNISDFLISFLMGGSKRYLREGSVTKSNCVSLKQLNSVNFQQVTFNQSQNVIVLFYSRDCSSWCGMVSQTLLRLAHSLTLVPSMLFARINMDVNDLPFYLQVHSYPTLIIFPANRKSESRVYPAKKPWSLHNITQFILSNLEAKQRVLAMIAACSKWGDLPSISHEGDSCIKDVRIGIIELISITLRKWRTNVRRRRKHFETLSFLKNAHLKLAKVDKISATLSMLI